jgi:hypothetical protein
VQSRSGSGHGETSTSLGRLGGLDVALNAQDVELTAGPDRSLLSGLHTV